MTELTEEIVDEVLSRCRISFHRGSDGERCSLCQLESEEVLIIVMGIPYEFPLGEKTRKLTVFLCPSCFFTVMSRERLRYHKIPRSEDWLVRLLQRILEWFARRNALKKDPRDNNPIEG